MQISKISNYWNKILIFYKSNSTNYFNSITKCCISEKPLCFNRYYLDFSSKADYREEIDSNGIPIYFHNYEKKNYHPIVIAQYALGLYELLYNNNFQSDHLTNKFLIQADWFIKNKIEKNESYCWLINYDINKYKIEAPWFSAMAQGEVISVLTRAYKITKDRKYLNVAEKTLNLFEISVQDGGLVNYFKDIPIYEEYPSKIKTVGVLNGFIFSLFGLFDLYMVNNNQRAKYLFDKGINSLKELLPYFDMNYWSQYYLFDYPTFYPATYTYHCLGFEQLKVLSILTNEQIFNEYYKKWYSQSLNNINKTRVLLNKIFISRSK